MSLSHPRTSFPWLLQSAAAVLLVTLTLYTHGAVGATETDLERGQAPIISNEAVFTSFEEIWAVPEAQKEQWFNVRLDYTVYYFDPVWKAMWGRCGETNNFASIGDTKFAAQVGQRIRIEGRVQPARGAQIENAKVTVLAESVPLAPVPFTGEMSDTSRLDRHLVLLDAYVDRQMFRDPNHLELFLICQGRQITGELQLADNTPVPQLQGSLIRAKGVYFLRNDRSVSAPKSELWIQGLQDLNVTGSLERDPRFEQTPLAGDQWSSRKDGSVIQVVGRAQPRETGCPWVLRVGSQEISLDSPQTTALSAGAEVEAIGVLAQDGSAWVLRQSLYRKAQPAFTEVGQLWNLSDIEQQKYHRVRLEFVVYYFDAKWKALWGRNRDRDEYLSLGDKDFPIRPGQKILIQGRVCPSKGMAVEDARVSVLEDSVPLVPASTTGHVTDARAFNRALVTQEGYVDRQARTDKNHVELDVVAEGRTIIVRLLIGDNDVVPKWEGAMLRLTGVYSATIDPTGGTPTIELWTSGLRNVQAIGMLSTDERFNLALTSIERVEQAGPDNLIRIEGVARSQQPGKSVSIRDETGQVNLLTPQARNVRFGERVEAIGYPFFDGSQWILRDGLFRASQSAPSSPPTGLPKLRLADQLRELPPEEAARGYPVQLSGVVTWARPNADFIFIHDVSGGVCVFRPADFPGSPVIGTKVEISGISAPGKFTPVVMASHLQAFSSVELPEPRVVTLEQALTGIEEAQWVSMSGYVRSVRPDGPWTRMELTTSGGEFEAMLPANDRWAKLPGSVVTMKGVCSARTNTKRQLTGIEIWVPTSRFVEIEEAAPVDPFTVPRRSIASLRQFSSLEALNRRVGVTGVVVHHERGRLVSIQEGAEGLMVLSRDTLGLVPGDRIEAVGFPGRENSRLVLREAVYRKVASGDQPLPRLITQLTPIDAERDGLLVQVEGMLVDIGAREKGTRLMLQRDGVFFEATIDHPKAEIPATWKPGSRLLLTGVYEIGFDEYRRPHGVRLQLRNVADVRVLSRPSILTIRRVLAVAGVLAVCVVLGVGWVLALRRRVHHQTEIIRDQLEKEKAARLDAALARASKLESVGVLAGGIAHDFNNLLTVVIGNLSLAKLDRKIDGETVQCLEESEKAAARAKDLTQQLLTFAKGGEPVRMSACLSEIVREATQFGLHGSNVRSEFNFAPDVWPANVDKGQIAQVVHNLIINASQAMAAGGLIRIAMSNEEVGTASRPGLTEGKYVRLCITDSGGGIPAENLARIFEPYFTTKAQGSGLGLATVYSIIKKHGGLIEVQSTIGQGTTFQVWLPAAQTAPVTPCTADATCGAKSGRVLIMDDELAIRRLGSAVIKRMGLEVTAVDDGAAVVHEYTAARDAGRPYDLVILDLTVPGGMGGAEAMEKLREINRDVRAIVSSGYSSDPVMANHQSFGFCGRVPKPYTATDLIEAVKRVMKPQLV